MLQEVSFVPIEESASSVFTDAVLISEEGQLVFASLWGHETGILQLLSQWELGPNAGGIDTLTLLSDDVEDRRLSAQVNASRLKKYSGRSHHPIFGPLAQAFVYDQRAQQVNGGQRQSWFLMLDVEPPEQREANIWETVKAVCPLPLLDHWRAWFMARCDAEGWVTQQPGFRMSGCKVDFSNQVLLESVIGEGIVSGALALEEAAARSDPNSGNQTSRHTRLHSGELVDVSEMGREAGFSVPIAVTDTVWHRYIAWSDKDSARQTYQDLKGRQWDVLYGAAVAVKSNKQASTVVYELQVIVRDGSSTQPALVTLNSVIGSGDDGEPAITIMVSD